jgi:hypothetical protein
MCQLSEARLLAYRRKALSLENSLEESDYADGKDPLDDALSGSSLIRGGSHFTIRF